ncbi:MAG TPA: FAD-dependent oxidoreductase [Bacteroidia bacterium]|nr:FAD-dependent oxidoreductase [Bacteroidia bacterium]
MLVSNFLVLNNGKARQVDLPASNRLRMHLRTYEPFSLINNGLLNSYPSLHHDEKSQIVVVGGGITGALVSHALMQKNYSVIMIDRRDIGCGSTAATTSMLQYEIDVPLYKLADMIGENEAVFCYRQGIEAIGRLEQLVRENDIDCGFEKKQSLFVARNCGDASWLIKEFEMRQKYNLGVRWLGKEEVFNDYGIRSQGAILSSVAGSVDAYRLTHRLIAMNAARGMQVYDQTFAEKFDLNSTGATVYLESGNNIRCDKVVFCSGYEAAEILKEQPADLFYTYACVSERGIKLPAAIKNTLVWDTGNPYLYMRTTDDGRLLVGGEDSANRLFFLNRTRKIKSKRLHSKLKRLMPGTEFLEDFSWGGTFGSTKDGLPYVGLSPEYKNAVFVLAYGGNGITFSAQAMQIVTELLDGKENDLAKLYRFGR